MGTSVFAGLWARVDPTCCLHILGRQMLSLQCSTPCMRYMCCIAGYACAGYPQGRPKQAGVVAEGLPRAAVSKHPAGQQRGSVYAAGSVGLPAARRSRARRHLRGRKVIIVFFPAIYWANVVS